MMVGDHFMIPRFELLNFVKAFEKLFSFVGVRKGDKCRLAFFMIRFVPQFKSLVDYRL